MTIRVGTDCSGKEALIQALRVNVVKEIIKQIQKTNTKNNLKHFYFLTNIPPPKPNKIYRT